jgi:hypothetical protein
MRVDTPLDISIPFFNLLMSLTSLREIFRPTRDMPDPTYNLSEHNEISTPLSFHFFVRSSTTNILSTPQESLTLYHRAKLYNQLLGSSKENAIPIPHHKSPNSLSVLHHSIFNPYSLQCTVMINVAIVNVAIEKGS